jgi:hypothetical protein
VNTWEIEQGALLAAFRAMQPAPEPEPIPAGQRRKPRTSDHDRRRAKAKAGRKAARRSR